MRQSVRRVLDADPEIEVLDTARDGLDALVKIERLQPDVVTLDVEMPNLDGLSALRLLMERFPRPVVMFSSLTAAGTDATVQALSLGAADFLCKPSGQSSAGISAIAEELVSKVKRAARARIRRPLAVTPVRLPVSPAPRLPIGDPAPTRLLVVGSSTGGPRALAELMGALPSDLGCAIVIVQHLPAGFTRSLAERLNQLSPLEITEARDGDILTVGRALLAPGDFHLKLGTRRVALDMGPRRHGVRPSVDTTLEDAAAVFGGSVLGVILTGMGEDGAAGAGAVKAVGGRVLAEDESTCAVFGMPHAVITAGHADEVVPLDRMAAAIVRHLELLPERSTRRPSHAY
ncbi:MAG: chemotaxis response regulator protein-glutamate methylesterase [Chloroflexi bacterium]|nr:chemotaxis response regulator protein-glutamate methylesterase [Chloroflexota bacterium]